jgi:hypothetical protein
VTDARSLLRYTGPKAAYLGAIGVEVPGGVSIAGRTVAGRGVPPVYQVTCGVDVVATWDSWQAATADLALRVPADLAGHVLEHQPTPCGFEVSDGATVWRLEPV